jgi:hypothetical protein
VGEKRRTYHWGAAQPTDQRLTVAQAAAALGITEGAVRSRIKRGTLPTTKEGGTVFVLWGGGTSQANQAPNTGVPTDRTAELIAALEGQIADLREQVRSERQAHAEARRLLAAALERIPPQLEAPSQDPPGTPSEATEQPGRVEPQPAVESAQEPRESSEMHMPEAGGGPLPRDQQRASERSWWRRIFGG